MEVEGYMNIKVDPKLMTQTYGSAFSNLSTEAQRRATAEIAQLIGKLNEVEQIHAEKLRKRGWTTFKILQTAVAHHLGGRSNVFHEKTGLPIKVGGKLITFDNGGQILYLQCE